MTTVLIADDEADVRELLRVDLEAEGYKVLEARNGAEALDRLAAEAVDVLLLDVRMPGVDGWAVLDTLSGTGRLGGMHVVVISAHGGEEAMARALSSGAAHYLKKPFRFPHLASLLPPPRVA